jgi:aspartate aminotransferase
MISKKIQAQMRENSIIKEMFEDGAKMRKLYGDENVYDLSLGNPNVPPPKELNQIIYDILENEKPVDLHGYTNNAGFEDTRSIIAGDLNNRFGTAFGSKNIIMTCGAAGGLNVILKALLDTEDEVLAFAPYFLEYKTYVDNNGGKLAVVAPNLIDFHPNLDEFEQRITEKTKAVIINSPNNPTGVVYSEDTIKKLTEILKKAQYRLNKTIYLISDEPYRELVYDDVFVPCVTKYYENTIICYSFSKSLSIPGQRIGYLAIPNEAADSENVISAAAITNRILGFGNAPAIMQKVVEKCVGMRTDINCYNRNREALYNGLTDAGYECVKPQGAFYMFVKSPIKDDVEFCELAKKYNILIIAGTHFECPGYVRIAYCVRHETIVAALPKFKALIEEVRKTC